LHFRCLSGFYARLGFGYAASIEKSRQLSFEGSQYGLTHLNWGSGTKFNPVEKTSHGRRDHVPVTDASLALFEH
jgi:hypothetical protein